MGCLKGNSTLPYLLKSDLAKIWKWTFNICDQEFCFWESRAHTLLMVMWNGTIANQEANWLKTEIQQTRDMTWGLSFETCWMLKKHLWICETSRWFSVVSGWNLVILLHTINCKICHCVIMCVVAHVYSWLNRLESCNHRVLKPNCNYLTFFLHCLTSYMNSTEMCGWFFKVAKSQNQKSQNLKFYAWAQLKCS